MRTVGTSRTVLACVECGTPHPKWSGQCAGCGAWNTMVEEAVAAADAADPGRLAARRSRPVCRLADVDALLGGPRPTGIAELDRVLGGGLVPGSVTLLGGEPGIGKSTLLLQLLAGWPGATLYVSAEESAQQVRAARRAARRRASTDLWLPAETSLPHVIAAIDERRPRAGASSTASRPIADQRARVARRAPSCRCAAAPSGSSSRPSAATSPMVLVGHVTKDGGARRAAGARARRRHGAVASRATATTPCACCGRVKHRFGSTNELGLFEMAGGGLVRRARSVAAVPRRPSRRRRRLGRRADAGGPSPAARRGAGAHRSRRCRRAPARRNAQGLDAGRLALLLAVLERRRGLRVGDHDVFASTRRRRQARRAGRRPRRVPGRRQRARRHAAVAPTSSLLGEVGLGGELRQVAHAGRRLAEAARLGVPAAPSCPRGSPDVRGHRASIRVPHARRGASPPSTTSPEPEDRTRVQPRRIPTMPARKQSVPTTSCARRSPRSHRARRCATGSNGSCGPRRGALLVLDDGPDVLAICSGGFLVDAPYSPQRLSELAKMDGAIIISAERRPHRPRQRPPRARPDGADQRDRHPPPHGRARRPLARGAGRVGVSEEMGVINVYAGGSKHQLQDIGRLLDRANQALQTLERYKVRLDDALVNLTAARARGRRHRCATSSPSCSAARWCTASPTRSRR